MPKPLSIKYLKQVMGLKIIVSTEFTKASFVIGLLSSAYTPHIAMKI